VPPLQAERRRRTFGSNDAGAVTRAITREEVLRSNLDKGLCAGPKGVRTTKAAMGLLNKDQIEESYERVSSVMRVVPIPIYLSAASEIAPPTTAECPIIIVLS